MKNRIVNLSLLAICLLTIKSAYAQPIYPLPNWAAALEEAYNCAWISNAGSEPPDGTAPWLVNGRYVCALMIMAGAGWCCDDTDPLSNGCDFDHDGTVDVLRDPAFPTNDCTIDGGDFWDLAAASEVVNDNVMASAKWYNEFDYFRDDNWDDENGPGASVDPSDIVLIGTTREPRENRTYVAREGGVDCSACERPGVSVRYISEQLLSLDNLIRKPRGPFGASSDQTKMIKMLLKGGSK